MSQQINLFNPVFLKQKKYFSVATMGQALGLIMLGSILFYAYAVYQVQLLSRQTAEMNRNYISEQTKLANFTREFSPQQTSQMLEDELKKIEAEAAAQESLLNLLKSGAIGNTEGYSGYMRAFARQSIKGLWLTAFDITGDGAQMSLSGAVVDPQLVPVYIQRLSKEKVMRGKSFAAMQMHRPQQDAGQPAARYVEFSLHSTAAAAEVKK
ncbi:MAG: fimbrial assembly protein [Nitrosomonadales bacterium]|nr:fimbrial assembly protein [Nitrosomonadales bacterium]